MFVVALIALGAVGCGVADRPVDSDPVHHRAERPLGEPKNGYPTWNERVVFYLTNKARAEPTLFNEEEVYEPTAPLRWDHPLANAARWQSGHIADEGCWCEDHSSCCDVQKSGGEVSCAGGSNGCGVTSAQARVTLWSPQYSGENAIRGRQNPQQAFEGWVNSSGHWRNINNGIHDLLGVGFQKGVYVQDFGKGARPPTVTGGIHFSNGSTTTFGINYYQRETGGPQEAMVVVDGQCHDLELAAGQPESGAFEAQVNLDQSCARYYFHVTDGEGNYHTYPTEGSFGAGGEDCEFYQRQRPADDCSPTGDPCETGDTRRCYTGPFGTENTGICEAGSERCIGGSWTRECRYETRPRADEVCGNGEDDDCDGETDEGCEPKEEGDGGSNKGCESAGGGPLSWSGIVLLFCAIRLRRAVFERRE